MPTPSHQPGLGPAPLVVVAAALIRDGRILAAQRSYPPELDGQWELPGGKVRPAESETAALQRECREELNVEIDVLERLGIELPTSGLPGVLRVYRCSLAGGEPVAREHHELRWLTAAELESVSWLATDRPLVPLLRELLA